jgi:ADP-ribose pyrophosphatase YjhB (NUDIX family)
MAGPEPHFCSRCGAPLVERLIASEQRVRRQCEACGLIAYRNPLVLVNTIVAAQDRVLLCRRASDPGAGRWALPGGFMEMGESMEEAAAREIREETGVGVDPRELRLHAVVTLPDISEIYVGFIATLAEVPALVCGSECTDVRFCSEADIPWSEFSYPDIGVYLRMYFNERRAGAHPIHYGRIDATRVANTAFSIAAVEAASWPRPRN